MVEWHPGLIEELGVRAEPDECELCVLCVRAEPFGNADISSVSEIDERRHQTLQ